MYQSPTEKIAKIRKILNSGAEGLHPQHEIINSLREGMPKDTITVWDMTQLGYYSRPGWKTYNTSSYLDSGYSGNLGWAYPTSLGAKVAKPETPVVSISGDGGFMYNVQELSTAVKYGINVVCVVFNDGHYGNVRRDLSLDWSGDYGTSFVNPDFVKMAESYGALGLKVTDPEKLPSHGWSQVNTTSCLTGLCSLSEAVLLIESIRWLSIISSKREPISIGLDLSFAGINMYSNRLSELSRLGLVRESICKRKA